MRRSRKRPHWTQEEFCQCRAVDRSPARAQEVFLRLLVGGMGLLTVASSGMMLRDTASTDRRLVLDLRHATMVRENSPTP